MSAKPRETLINRNVVYRGKILDLCVDQIALPEGKTGIREIVLHLPAVAIVPILDHEHILLVRQYRYAVKRWFWEVPAGLRSKSESPLRAAKRELREETGYTANTWQVLGRFYSSPGYSQEAIHLFLARKLVQCGELELDEDEFVIPHKFTRKEINRKLKLGEIEDAKTVLALHMAAKEMNWKQF